MSRDELGIRVPGLYSPALALTHFMTSGKSFKVPLPK